MSLRASELAQVAEELNRGLSGGFVQKAYVPSRLRCYLELRQPGRSTLLLLSAEPDVARIAVAERRMKSENPEGLQRKLRHDVLGAQLLSVSAEGLRVGLIFKKGADQKQLTLDVGERSLSLGEPEPFGVPVEPTAPGHDSRLNPSASHAFPFAAAAEALYAQKERVRLVADARRALVQPLKAKQNRIRRTLEKVKGDAARSGAAPEHRRYGELLAQNPHLIRKGEPSVRLTEYTEEGPRDVLVPLDPKLPAKEQSARHFHFYRRLSRGAEHAQRRLAELASELKAVDSEIAKVQALDEASLLDAAASAPERTEEPRAQGRHTPARTYLGSGGARILVGKSAKDNDALTFKLARPHDLWLHARGVPGSHVVVPLERGQELPQELLLDAAHLAVHHSPLKEEPIAEVAYTHARFVRKVKGGAPGQVLYTREKVVRLRVEPGRIGRLLQSPST